MHLSWRNLAKITKHLSGGNMEIGNLEIGVIFSKIPIILFFV
jgi:hypothetical protein